MFVPLRTFEQTCPSAKELLLHYLGDFVSPSSWTHAGFQRFFVKPSPYARNVFLQWGLCSRCVLQRGHLHAGFLRCDLCLRCVLQRGLPSSCLDWLGQTLLASGQTHSGLGWFFVTPPSMFMLFLQQWKIWQILLAYLDKHILASIDSVLGLHLFSCYALATMTIPCHGLIGSGTCCIAHHTSTTKRFIATDCFIQL